MEGEAQWVGRHSEDGPPPKHPEKMSIAERETHITNKGQDGVTPWFYLSPHLLALGLEVWEVSQTDSASAKLCWDEGCVHRRGKLL